MTTILDTHFILWIATASNRLHAYPWLASHQPWGISPVSLLEIQFLSETGRLDVRNPAFTDALQGDPRFVIDDVPVVGLIRHALPLTWTRDPFDRLLAAHSLTRRIPLCTVNRTIAANHSWVLSELGGGRGR